MTTVLAIETSTDVIMGSDSRTTRGGAIADGGTKIHRSGPVVYATAGDVRGIDVIKHTNLPDFHGRTREDAENYLVTEMIPTLLTTLEANKALVVEDGKGNSEAEAIVAVGRHAFYLASNFALVSDSTGIYGVGSGSAYAKGVLHALAKEPDWNEEGKIRKALQIAAKLDAYTGGRLHVKAASEVK